MLNGRSFWVGTVVSLLTASSLKQHPLLWTVVVLCPAFTLQTVVPSNSTPKIPMTNVLCICMTHRTASAYPSVTGSYTLRIPQPTQHQHLSIRQISLDHHSTPVPPNFNTCVCMRIYVCTAHYMRQMDSNDLSG